MALIDVFRIGVILNMQSNAHGILNALSKDFLGLHAHITKAQGAMTGFKIAIGGLAAMTVGAGLLKGFKDLYEHGEDLIHQQTILQAALGHMHDASGGALTPAQIQGQIAGATDAAWATTREVSGTTVADNLHALQDLRQIFGDLDEAKEVLSTMQRSDQVLRDVKGQVSAAGGSQAFIAAKFQELRAAANGPDGRVDPHLFARQMSQLTQVVIGSDGRVDSSAFLGVMKQARGAGVSLSDDAMYGSIPAVIEAIGGQRAGTMLAAMFNVAAVGRMTNHSAAIAANYGLLDTNSGTVDARGNRHGAGLIEGRLEATDPVRWALEVVKPILDAHHVTDPIEQARIVADIMSNRVAAGGLTEMLRNGVNIMKDATLNRRTMGTGEAKQLMDAKDPIQNMRNLSAAWSNFLTAVGAPLVPAAITIMQKLTSALQSMTQFATAHPDIIRYIGYATLFVAALLLVGGAVAIIVVSVAAAVAAFSSVGLAIGVLAGGIPIALLTASVAGFLGGLQRLVDGTGEIARAIVSAIPGAGAVVGLTGLLHGGPAAVPPSALRGADGSGRVGAIPTPDAGPRISAPHAALTAPAHPAAWHPSAGPGHELVTNVNLVIDGEVGARATVRRMINQLNSPSSGPDAFDGTRHLTPV